MNDNLGKYIGIGISIPLLSGLERLTTLRKHKLNIFRLRNEEELQKQQLYTEVEQTVLSLRSGYDEFRQVLQQFRAEELVPERIRTEMGRGAYLRLSVDGGPQSLHLLQSRVGAGTLAGRYDFEDGNLLSHGELLYVAR